MEENWEYVDFNPILGDSFMPPATAVIIIYMMHSRVHHGALGLFAAFIFNLNPFYVVTSLLMLWMAKKNRKPKGYISKPKVTLSKSNPTKPIKLTVDNINSIPTEYDHILIGSNLSTLYAAALLSKSGHRCCVLQPSDAPPVEVYPDGAPCSAPIVDLSCGKIER